MASNPADYASRHPVGDPESHNYEVEAKEVSFVARNAVPKAITLSEIESATVNDQVLHVYEKCAIQIPLPLPLQAVMSVCDHVRLLA